MTPDDINNSNTRASIFGSECSQRINGVSSSWTESVVNARIEQSIWDQALASADDALVLVQWLESLRP
tara:strand:+ start:247 stop:450 length:204 start_codon:yes stop_codon:yes gene_type:complete